MLKIYELQDRALLPTRVYHALSRGINYRKDNDKFMVPYTDERGFTYDRIGATIDELFAYYGEEGLRSFRNIGSQSIAEMKAVRSIE